MRIKRTIKNWLSDLKNKRANLISKEIGAEYQNMIEHAVVGMYIIQDDCFRYVNTKWVEIHGYTFEEVVNKVNPLDLVYSEDRKIVQQNIEKRLSGESESLEFEFRGLRKTGATIWVKVLGKQMNYRGRPAIYGTITDITEQKENEVAMRISEERLRVTLETTQIGVWDWDLKKDIWYASPIYYSMLGYEPVTGPSDRKIWLTRVHPDDREMVQERINMMRAQKQDYYSYEARMLHADGSYRWHQVIGHIIDKDNQGKIKRMVGIRKDITEFKLAEEELEKNKRHLRTLIDTIPDLVWLKDPQGIYLQCNQRFEQLYGAPEKEIIGKTDYDFVNKELADFFRQKDNEARVAGRPSINEEEVTFADNHKEILETIKTPVSGYDGRFIGILGIGRDITKRKQIEQDLQENKRFLETLISNLPGMVYRCKNNINWTMEFISEGCLRLTGYKPEQLIYSQTISYGDIIHEADQEMVWNSIQDMLALKQPFFLEYRIIQANGTIKWVWEQGRGVFSESGDLLFLEGFITDITERKQAENELKESEELFKVLLKLIPYPISLTDFDNKFILVNDAFYKINNVCPSEVIGKTFDELGFKLENSIQEFIREEINTKGKVNNIEILATVGGGKQIEYLYSSVIIRWKNKSYILHSNIDITEKKKNERELEKHRQHLEFLVQERTEELDASLEELHDANEELMFQKEELQNTIDKLNSTRKQLVQSEKMASLGLLSSGIAHEINNPLNFIHGGSIALKNYFDKKMSANLEEVSPFFDAINEGVRRVSQIIKSLNHYSRKDDVQKVKCDMHTIIDNCLIILENKLKSRIEIRKKYTKKAYTIFGNEGKLHQAILNIIVNAEQSIDNKGIINIKTNVVEDQFVVEINDSGEGMSPETIEKIFDPFFTTKVPGKGTGLGLSITYNIIQEHNGKIRYKSKLGKGTKAIIILPI